MSVSVKKLQKTSIILRNLREIFLHEMASSFDNTLVTVTSLYICDKSRAVKVYVSFMPSQNGPRMLKELEKQKSKIRGFLGKRLANKLRTIPELKFYLDNSIERALHLEKLLNGFEVSFTKLAIQA
jgi:ribosome-binding factor A